MWGYIHQHTGTVWTLTFVKSFTVGEERELEEESAQKVCSAHDSSHLIEMQRGKRSRRHKWLHFNTYTPQNNSVLHDAFSLNWNCLLTEVGRISHYQRGLLVCVSYTVCGYSMVGILGLPALIHTAGLSQLPSSLPPPRSYPVLALHD